MKHRLTFVPEENGTAVVITENDDLVLFRSNIHNRAVRLTFPEIYSLDSEQPVRSQVSEVQYRRAAGLLHQRHVENVSSLNASSNGIRKDHSVSFISSDVVHDDGSGSGIAYVHVHLTVIRVIDHQILQTRQWIHQNAQIDHLHNLQGWSTTSLNISPWH